MQDLKFPSQKKELDTELILQYIFNLMFWGGQNIVI